MVHSNRSNGRYNHVWILNDICRVNAATDSALKHDIITLFIHKMQEPNDCYNLKESHVEVELFNSFEYFIADVNYVLH